MKNKLITALRLSANAIENRTFAYDWPSVSNCNCGVLACAITGLNPLELDTNYLDAVWDTFPSREGNWSDFVGTYCPITGTPTHELLVKLLSTGLTPQDIVHLERLSDPAVLARLPKRTARRFLFFTEKLPAKLNKARASDVVTYMRAWADLLVEQGRSKMGALDGTEQKPAEEFLGLLEKV